MAVDWNQSGNQAPSDTPSSATGGGWAPAIAQAVKAALDALNAKGQTPSDTSNTASGSQTNQNQPSSQPQQSSSQPPRPDPNTSRALQAARLISSTTNPQDKVAKIRSLLLPIWRNLNPQVRAMIAHSLGYTPDQISAMAAAPLRASLYTPEVPAQETPGATPAREIPVENAPGTLRG